MNRSGILTRAALAAALCGASLEAHATVLLNLVNPPAVSNQSYALSFVATQSTTQINIAGYQVPASEVISDNQVLLNNTGSNLLGQTWTLTPAASGSRALQGYDDSNPAVNELYLEGVSAGSYDVFSQTVNTIVGDTYYVDFNYTNYEPNSPSAFLVNTGAAITAAPEPAAWGLMLLGFGLMGGSLRMRSRNPGALRA